MSGSLNGELLASSTLASAAADLPPKPLARSSLSVAPADYPERPEVTLRREASSSTLPLKTEVPLHLFSTTNQLHKPVGVQQQIPTKLAALSSSKGKAGKSSRAPHRSDSSGEPAAVLPACKPFQFTQLKALLFVPVSVPDSVPVPPPASVDMRQMLPMKLSAPGDGALKARRSVSPNQQLPLSGPLPHHSLHLHPGRVYRTHTHAHAHTCTTNRRCMFEWWLSANRPVPSLSVFLCLCFHGRGRGLHPDATFSHLACNFVSSCVNIHLPRSH